jgi:hypothetical protein
VKITSGEYASFENKKPNDKAHIEKHQICLNVSFLYVIKHNINHINERIKILKTEVFDTQIRGKRTVDVKTEPKNDQIVEKKSNFQIFSQVLFPFNTSDNKGIV